MNTSQAGCIFTTGKSRRPICLLAGPRGCSSMSPLCSRIRAALTSVLFLPLAFGCAAGQQRSPITPVADSALWHTVLLDLRQTYGSILEVDPWPLDSGVHVNYPASPYRLAGSTSIREQLRGMILSLGLQVADSVSVGTCPGTFVADSADVRCPSRRRQMVAMSMPRGNLSSTKTSLELLGARPAPTGAEVAVRVVTAYVSPFGSEASVVDHYYRRAGTAGWEPVGRMTLSSMH